VDLLMNLSFDVKIRQNFGYDRVLPQLEKYQLSKRWIRTPYSGQILLRNLKNFCNFE
jgi:hypothetical protein